MTLPAFLFGFLISTLIGASFHLWKDGGLGKLLLYIALSWAGFWIGHFLAVTFDLHLWDLGPLRLGLALVGSMILIGAGYWLSLVKFDEPKRGR